MLTTHPGAAFSPRPAPPVSFASPVRRPLPLVGFPVFHVTALPLLQLPSGGACRLAGSGRGCAARVQRRERGPAETNERMGQKASYRAGRTNSAVTRRAGCAAPQKRGVRVANGAGRREAGAGKRQESGGRGPAQAARPPASPVPACGSRGHPAGPMLPGELRRLRAGLAGWLGGWLAVRALPPTGRRRPRSWLSAG